jgi:hypothetical protein
VESLVDESNRLSDELWIKTMGVFDWDNWICQLRARFGCKTAWGHTTCAKDGQTIIILWVIQKLVCFGSHGKHQTRLKAELLILIKKESNGLRDPVTSENTRGGEIYHW